MFQNKLKYMVEVVGTSFNTCQTLQDCPLWTSFVSYSSFEPVFLFPVCLFEFCMPFWFWFLFCFVLFSVLQYFIILWFSGVMFFTIHGCRSNKHVISLFMVVVCFVLFSVWHFALFRWGGVNSVCQTDLCSVRISPCLVSLWWIVLYYCVLGVRLHEWVRVCGMSACMGGWTLSVYLSVCLPVCFAVFECC